VTVAFAAAASDVVAAYNDKIHKAGCPISVLSLPTAVNLDLFKATDKFLARGRLGISNRSPVFAFVGRLAAVKGIPLLVEAFVIVLHHHPNALLLLAGEGEESGKIERMVQDQELNDKVLFLGQCPPNKLVDVISSADACLCGSYSEGFSNAMVEQIACGRPIVTTDVSGARDLVKDGVNGFIVKERTPEVFASRMLDVLTLETGGIFSRKMAEDMYSEKALWATVAEHWPALRTGDQFSVPQHAHPTG
jgi:glycosyltransferase involved in cell wall biosynthesis